MTKPTLILIHGHPATGKTTLSKRIAEHFQLPLLTRDVLKEIIFGNLGWSDREWSKKVGSTTFHLLDYLVEEQLKAGHSLIVESPLNPEFENEKFKKWQQQYDFYCIQIICQADTDVLVERFMNRAKQSRHPGHVDEGNLEEYKTAISQGKTEALDLDGLVVEINTTDFEKIDLDAILAQISL